MSTIRDSFVARFGEEQADALEAAGNGHRDTLLEGDKHGSDAFRDAVVIAIGFQCFEVDGYRESHGITAPADDIKAWIREEADLAHHQGPIDYLAMMAGAYNEYMPEKEDA